ncbi:MAG: hypothetical protein LLG00_10975 [Planctomycetaceae bacterium]|nr:hypothetical protein [Planctomycetaceae bacterium]
MQYRTIAHHTRLEAMDTANQFDLLRDLEARQDELMVRLEELDKRIERTLAEWQRYGKSTSGCSAADHGRAA